MPLDFLIEEKYMLIPSVYAACEKNKDGSVGCNRPTYIDIRSGKHDKSSAALHIEDFWALLSHDEFEEVCLKVGVLKPMLFVSVDGGPEEVPNTIWILLLSSDMLLVGIDNFFENRAICVYHFLYFFEFMKP